MGDLQEEENKMSLRRSLRLSTRSPTTVRTIKRRTSTESSGSSQRTRSKTLSYSEDTSSLCGDSETEGNNSNKQSDSVYASTSQEKDVQISSVSVSSNCIVNLERIEEAFENGTENDGVPTKEIFEEETQSTAQTGNTFSEGNCVVVLTPITEVGGSETEANKVNTAISENDKMSQKENNNKENISPDKDETTEANDSVCIQVALKEKIPLFEAVKLDIEDKVELSSNETFQNAETLSNSSNSESLGLTGKSEKEVDSNEEIDIICVDDSNKPSEESEHDNSLQIEFPEPVDDKLQDKEIDEMLSNEEKHNRTLTEGSEQHEEGGAKTHAVNLNDFNVSNNTVEDVRSTLQDTISLTEGLAVMNIIDDKKIESEETKENADESVKVAGKIIESASDDSSTEKNSTVGDAETFTADDNVGGNNKSANDEVKRDLQEINNPANHTSSNCVSNDISEKIDELLSRTCSSDSEAQVEHNPFIDSMAEEGEEDTPSEGSNDIVDKGEEINTTESELSTDEYCGDSSFIDDESYQLLPGEEYDLSFENAKKKTSRIIELSNVNDDAEVIVPNKLKKEKDKKRKRSRIIRYADSSDEENCVNEVEDKQLNDSTKIDSNEEAAMLADEDILDDTKTCHDEQQTFITTEKKVISNDLPVTIDENNTLPKSNLALPSRTGSTPEGKSIRISMDKQKWDINAGDENNLNDTTQSAVDNQQKLNSNISNIVILENIKLQDINQDHDKNLGTTKPIVDDKQKLGNKIAIFENVNVQDISDEDFSKRINEVINSLCFKMKGTNQVSINFSVIIENAKRKKISKNHKRNKKRISLVREQDCVKESKSKRKTKFSDQKKCEVNQQLDRTRFTEQPHFSLHQVVKGEMLNFKNERQSSKKAQKRALSDVDKNDVNVHKGAKKKKRNKSKSKKNKEIGGEVTKMNLLDEALLDCKEKRVPSLQPSFSNNGWEVEKVTVEPSQANESVKEIKHFHAKDFKNLMTFDNSRVKRNNTNQMLMKKHH